jgi:hypothetical protein
MREQSPGRRSKKTRSRARGDEDESEKDVKDDLAIRPAGVLAGAVHSRSEIEATLDVVVSGRWDARWPWPLRSDHEDTDRETSPTRRGRRT